MTDGFVRYLAICAALAVCVASPTLLSLAVFLLVFGLVLLLPSAERER